MYACATKKAPFFSMQALSEENTPHEKENGEVFRPAAIL